MLRLTNASLTAAGPTGTTTVLHPLSLELAEHRIALIGPNGSGKSSLARLLNGLALPTTGTVEFHTPEGDWINTAQHGSRIRQHVSFVFTDPAAGLVMPTAVEDVALSLRRTIRRRAQRLDAARAVLSTYGLESIADNSVHTLSGGQRQLLAIASALAVHPDVLIADEPTTLLDLRNSRRIADMLLGLDQQLIVATHNLDLAAACDRALVIIDGRVAFDGGAGDAIDFYRTEALG